MTASFASSCTFALEGHFATKLSNDAHWPKRASRNGSSLCAGIAAKCFNGPDVLRVNFGNELCGNILQILGNLSKNDVGKALGRGPQTLNKAQSNRADNDELVKLGLDGDESVNAGFGGPGNVASDVGQSESLVEGERLHVLGNGGSLLDGAVKSSSSEKNGNGRKNVAGEVGKNSVQVVDILVNSLDSLVQRSGVGKNRGREGKGGNNSAQEHFVELYGVGEMVLESNCLPEMFAILCMWRYEIVVL